MSWRYWIAVSEYETPTWLIPGKASTFASIWFKFRCTRELSAYVLSHVMTDPAQLIWQSNLARRLSGRYWVLVSEFETHLAYSWQSRLDCWHLLKVQVYRRLLGTYRHDCHYIIANPNPQSTQSTRLLSSCVGISDMGSLIRGKAAALCRNIIVVRAHLRSASESIGDWDTAHVFMVQLHLSLLGMSWPMIWPMIEVQVQLRSAIQSRMTYLDFYEVSFGKLQLIVNVSFQVTHASTVTISLQSACSPLHSAHLISLRFILIMFSSAWISGCWAHRLSSLKTLHI